jgi:hypothetical protein
VPWWVDAIGWAGSALLVWSLLQTQVLRLRLLNTVGAIVLVGYNLLIVAWPMVALNAVIIVINLVQIWRLRGPITATGYDLLEVDPKDEYLRHTLRVHEGDIREFNPGFLWDPAAPETLAVLVLRGNETVGVVLLHRVGATVAQIDLDYVTKRYRDFTPGRFVYGRSGWFAQHGLARLLAAEGMVGFEDYFAKMGFAWQEGRLVRDL